MIILKKICIDKKLCWGIPLERAVRCVGVADLIFGMLFFAIFFLHLSEVEHRTPPEKQIKPNAFGAVLRSVPHWLLRLIMIAHIIKLLMGIVIYIGAIVKNARLCQIWLLISGIGSIFAIPTYPVHIYGLVVVYQFLQEVEKSKLSKERKLSNTLPDSIDAYVPKCENNNDVNDKYIGFGNTTLARTDFTGKSACAKTESLESQRRCYIPVLPASIETSNSIDAPSFCCHVDGEDAGIVNDAFNKTARLQDSSNENEMPGMISSNRFFAITPTPSSKTQHSKLEKPTIAIPTVVVTTTGNQLNVIAQHI